MNFMALFFAFLCALPISLMAEVEPYEYFLCSNKNFVRSLRIDIEADKSCKTQYSKGGVDRVIGSGIHLESCQRFLNNVKENLEGAGWNCKKLESVTMSSHQ